MTRFRSEFSVDSRLQALLLTVASLGAKINKIRYRTVTPFLVMCVHGSSDTNTYIRCFQSKWRAAACSTPVVLGLQEPLAQWSSRFFTSRKVEEG